jgi:glycerol-1-phosphate dehydrogenase [NAD(P)+]
VADRNTWKAMGEEVEQKLRSAGLATRSTIYEEQYLAADAESIFRLLVDDDPEERLYVAVGSGTITDIVRFATHRTGRAFVSMATAPSVDAYASIVAPVVVEGMKRTVPAQAPVAVFADSEALARAPRAMIAAGFGDMICKFSAVADWRMGALVWGEPFDEAIARRSVEAAKACVDAAAAIGETKPEGLATLMAAVVESGLCMAEAGHSRPASGAEHQYSHFWEMRLLLENRPPVLHGLKVGIGTIEAARLWDIVRGISRDRAAELLRASRLPDRAAEERKIRAAYRGAAEETIAAQSRFLGMSEADYEALKAKLLEHWDDIQSFVRSVPSEEETRRLLELAGCPTDARKLGLGRKEIAQSIACAHYIRDRFTVKKLCRMLGVS